MSLNEDTKKALNLLLRQAQEAHEAAAKTGDFAAALAPLTQAEEALRQAQEATGNLLPPDLESLAGQVKNLRQRAEVAGQAMTQYAAGNLADAVRTLRAATALRGEDLVLSTLRSRLEEEFKTQAEEASAELLRRADTAIEDSNLTDALDFLLQARELQPTPEIQSRYNQLRRHKTLEDRLRDAEADYQGKLATHSLPDALKPLRLALDALLEPDSGLPQEVRDKLLDLVMLGDREDSLALGKGEQWQMAQNLLGQIGRAGTLHWTARWAYYFADPWARLAREVALKGIIASAMELGNIRESYQAAAARVRAHPTNDKVIKEHAEIRELLIKRLNDSASKRLSRAEQMLVDLHFTVTLDNLWSLEVKIYGPVDAEFPGLLEGYDEVAKVRGEAERLRGQAERLKSLYEWSWPFLEDARQAFLADELDEAEKRLDNISEDVRELPDLEAQVDSLHQLITHERAKKAADLLIKADVGLRFASNEEDYKQIVDDLLEFDRSRFSSEPYEIYLAILQFTKQARDASAEKQEWLKMRQPQHYSAAQKGEKDAQRRASEEIHKLLKYCKRLTEKSKGRTIRIFVSSTWRDLQEEREAVEAALHRMKSTTFSGMEYFGSQPETPKEVCLTEVARSHVYIGIFAHRYGSLDKETGLSMTEVEYRKAQERDIPCLIYLMDDSVPVLPANIERDTEKAAKLEVLKRELLGRHAVSFFTSPDNLATQVVADLHNLLANLEAIRP